jgi:PelA/Pel-15E family pectate lyase
MTVSARTSGCTEQLSSRTSEASVGIYLPCNEASHAPVQVDPDTRPLRSLLRDDMRAIAMAVLVLASGAALGCAGQPATGTPAPVVADGTRDLLAPERLARLPDTQRSAWLAYLDHSRRLHDADTASMNAELRSVGSARMTKASYAGPQFDLAGEKDDAWFRGDSARTIADAVITYQTPSGGWSKRTAMTRPRRTGESYYAETDAWHYIPTLDNGATTGQLRFLQRVIAAHPDARHAAAWRRGLQYLLVAQQPNGCWPQDFPLDGGYHDAITFNDDAVVNVLGVLDTVAAGGVSIATAEERDAAAAAVRHGVDCLLATQVVVNGAPTVWGQQHDPLTLEVVPARRYELAALSGRESATIMTYLMSLPGRDARVERAVRAAAAWFRGHAVMGYAYDFHDGLRAQPGAGPIWPRLTEIETGRAIFANRDGVKLYDWNQLTDRRTGYAWFGTEPASALRKFDKWVKTR